MPIHYFTPSAPVDRSGFSAILRPAYSESKLKLFQISTAILVILASANASLCQATKFNARSCPTGFYFTFIPVFLVLVAPFLLRNFNERRHFYSQLYENANVPITEIFQKMLDYFPQATQEHAQILSRMSFLQLRRLWEYDKAKTVTTLAGVQTFQSSFLRKLDDISKEQRIENIQSVINELFPPNLHNTWADQQQELEPIVFTFDAHLKERFGKQAEVYQPLKAVLAAAFPKLISHSHSSYSFQPTPGGFSMAAGGRRPLKLL